jgi:multidrug resistance efflux pump
MKVKFHLDKKRNPQSNDGMKVGYGLAKRGGYRIRWFLILALILSPLVVAAYYFYRSNILIIAPAILTSKPVIIASHDDGVIEQIRVKAGSSILDSQAILTISSHKLNAQISFIKDELNSLRAEPSRIEILYFNAIEESKDSLAKVTDIQSRYKEFRDKGQISELDYASITGMVNGQNKQVNDQYIDFDEAKSRIAEREQAGPIMQQRRALQKELVLLEVNRSQMTIEAPFDGRILELNVVEGQRVRIGDQLALLADNKPPRIVAFLEPKYLDFAKAGAKVVVVLPDSKKFTGTVSQEVGLVSKLPVQLVSPFEGQPAYLKVLIDLDKVPDSNYWIEGLTVDVHF